MNYKCNDCNNLATRIIAVDFNGKICNIHVCDACAQKYEQQNAVYQTYRAQEPQCPVCGTRLSEILDSQYVGCSECYNTFRFEVLKKINNMYGTRKNVGKRLKERSQRFVLLDENESMREQYYLAVEEGRKDDAEEILGFIKGGKNNG